MKRLIERFYEHGAKGLYHSGIFSIASWFGNIEFQIVRYNQPIISCRIVNGQAVIQKITDDADRYMSVVRAVVSEHHQLA